MTDSSISVHPKSEIKSDIYAGGFFVKRNPDIVELGHLMCFHVWSPCIWLGGRRKKVNFEMANYIAMDFDDGKFTLKEACRYAKKQGLWHIIGTTKSHQLRKVTPKGKTVEPCDRYRFIVKMSEPCVDLEEYEYNCKLLMDRFPCDPSVKDGARFFYPCRSIYQKGIGHQPAWKPLPPTPVNHEEIQARRRAYSRAQAHFCRSNRFLPNWIRVALNFGTSPGGRHQLCYRLGAEMGKLGYLAEEIFTLAMRGPLAEIGESDVKRAIGNGWAKCSQNGDINRLQQKEK